MKDLTPEEENIAAVIKSARTIQEFLWGDMNKDAGLEEFRRMFRKRIAKIEEVDMNNPHWRVELKKRLLQTAAIAVNLITKIDNDKLTHDGIHPDLPSNLPQYAAKAVVEKAVCAVKKEEMNYLGKLLLRGNPLLRTMALTEHEIILAAMCRLTERSEPIDMLTVFNELKANGELDHVGGPMYLAELTDSVPF